MYQQRILMLLQKHVLPLINKTSSEMHLTFASCLDNIMRYWPSPSQTFLSPHPSLYVPTPFLSPLLQLQSSALSSAHTPSNTNTHQHMHTLTDKPLHLPAPSAHTAFPWCPLLLLFSSWVLGPSCCQIHISTSQKYTDRICLGSLELINSKVAALDKLL